MTTCFRMSGVDSAQMKKDYPELQKKYNDGSIRILSNKTFTKSESLKRKDRR